jgi:hypothetical protein
MSRIASTSTNADRLTGLPNTYERLAGGRGRYLGVDLHGDGDLAVPQDLHGNTWMDFEGGE